MKVKVVNVREKGKIPRNEWSNILARYNAGETITEIGRAYGCTAPAIRYIIKRSGTLLDRSAAPRRVSLPTPSKPGPDHEAPTAPPEPVPPQGERVFGADLRKRVAGDIAGFLVALDQAEGDTSDEVLTTLQEAADRLMRSTARVRLELERLLGDRELANAVQRRNPATLRHRVPS